MGILWTILIGFIAGVLAKLITPGTNEPSGFILTTILGIVGAFVFAILGAVVIGLALAGGEIDDAHLQNALEAIPGAVAGLAASYFIGIRREDPRLTHSR